MFRFARRRARLAAILSLSAMLAVPPRFAVAAPVAVTGAWFRYLLSAIPAGGYMTLHNPGATAMVLTGARSPACGSLLLHRSETGGGTERMVRVRQITLPPRGQAVFAPGGYHLMCLSPHMHPGQTVIVTLRFADGSRQTARFTVRGANGTPPATSMKMKMQ